MSDPVAATVRATLSLTVLGKDHTETALWIERHTKYLSEIDDFNLVTNAGSRFGGYGKIGQAALVAARGLGVEVFGMIHADTVFYDGFEAFVASAKSGKVCGFAGAAMGRRNVWSKDPGLRPPICLIDASSIFFRCDMPLDFDFATFDSHHCVAEDVGLTAREKGIELEIPRSNVEHLGSSLFRPEDKGQVNKAWINAYKTYLPKLRAKHPKIPFRMC